MPAGELVIELGVLVTLSDWACVCSKVSKQESGGVGLSHGPVACAGDENAAPASRTTRTTLDLRKLLDTRPPGPKPRPHPSGRVERRERYRPAARCTTDSLAPAAPAAGAGGELRAAASAVAAVARLRAATVLARLRAALGLRRGGPGQAGLREL